MDENKNDYLRYKSICEREQDLPDLPDKICASTEPETITLSSTARTLTIAFGGACAILFGIIAIRFINISMNIPYLNMITTQLTSKNNLFLFITTNIDYFLYALTALFIALFFCSIGIAMFAQIARKLWLGLVSVFLTLCFMVAAYIYNAINLPAILKNFTLLDVMSNSFVALTTIAMFLGVLLLNGKKFRELFL